MSMKKKPGIILDTTPRRELWWLAVSNIDKYIKCQKCNLASYFQELVDENDCPSCGEKCMSRRFEKLENGELLYLGNELHGELFFEHIPTSIINVLSSLAPKQFEREELAESETLRFKFGPGLDEEREAKDLSIIVFFCVLNESLLANTLLQIGELQGHDRKLIERLLNNQSSYGRIKKLFKHITGCSWKNVIDRLEKIKRENYDKLTREIENIMQKRHKIVHTGSSEGVSVTNVDQILESVNVLLEMHMDVYNNFVAASNTTG